MKIESGKRYLVKKWNPSLLIEVRCLEVSDKAYKFELLGWILKDEFSFDYQVYETL